MHRSETAAWVGYLVKLERQRRSITQSSLASALGFGMSYVSTIEAGNAYANIERTIAIVEHLGIDPSLCLAAVEAQSLIHHFLLRKDQKERKQHGAPGPQWNPPGLLYHGFVADKANGMPDQSRTSWPSSPEIPPAE